MNYFNKASGLVLGLVFLAMGSLVSGCAVATSDPINAHWNGLAPCTLFGGCSPGYDHTTDIRIATGTFAGSSSGLFTLGGVTYGYINRPTPFECRSFLVYLYNRADGARIFRDLTVDAALSCTDGYIAVKHNSSTNTVSFEWLTNAADTAPQNAGTLNQVAWFY